MPPLLELSARQRHGIRRRIASAFLLLGCFLAGTAVAVIVNLRHVSTDARRFREEDREAKLTFSLFATLKSLQDVARQDGREALALEVARDASRRLRELDQGHRVGDPSDASHQAAEDRIVASSKTSSASSSATA